MCQPPPTVSVTKGMGRAEEGGRGLLVGAAFGAADWERCGGRLRLLKGRRREVVGVLRGSEALMRCAILRDMVWDVVEE